MREIGRIAAGEISAGKKLVGLAAGLGLVVPFAVAPTRYYPDVVALVVSLALSHGVALLAGAAMLHAPLREGRLGFYFSRPITESGLWWGKWLGTTVLVMLVHASALLPAVLWTTLQNTTTGELLKMSALSMAVLPLSVLVGHAIAALLGAPGWARWANLALALVVFSLVSWCLARLGGANAVGAVYSLQVVTAVALFVGVVLGGLRQVRQGRVDSARGHRAFSLSLWLSVGAAALLGSGFTHWVLDIDPDHMALDRFEAGSETPWFAASFEGTALQNGVRALLLANAETGEWHELDRHPSIALPARLAQNGERVLWAAWDVRYGSVELKGWFADRSEKGLLEKRPLPEAIDLQEIDVWELSPSGDRVLDVHYRPAPARREELDVRVRVWSLETGVVLLEEWLTVPRVVRHWVPSTRAFWDDEETARLFVLGLELRLWSVDLETQSVTRGPSILVGDKSVGVFTSSPELTTKYRKRSSVRSGGVAMVRFSPGGELVLVGSRVAKDGVAKTNRTGPVRQPERRARSPRQTVLSLYDGRLEERRWTLDPLDEEVLSLHLVGERAVATTSPHDFGVIFGPGATRALNLQIGGAQGWQVRGTESWGVIGELSGGRLLAIDPDGAVATLQGESLVAAPESLTQLEAVFSGLFFDGGAGGRTFPWGIDGGEPRHPRVAQLLYQMTDDKRSRAMSRSLVRLRPGTTDGGIAVLIR